ncbi:MAG TPA: glycosyltransferase [Fimbriimonadaceae bacterium]|nr:glycosyltransferase [Fimbriimonadaceae bacterium]
MKVSVVIPSYNHARFLPTTLESVLRQTHRDWELLFIDDGSTDDSLEVASRYSDSRIQIHQNPENLGTYGTLNKGIDLASGDLIAVLNSDDFWLPEKLERQVSLLSKHPEASFSYTLGEVVDDEGRELEDFHQHRDYPREEIQDVLPYLLDVNQILASSVVFRKGAVRFNPQLRYCGDWVGALDLALQGPAVFVNEVMSYWRQHTGNASKQLLRTMPEEIAVRTAILEQRELWGGGGGVVEKHLALCALDLGAHHFLAGAKEAARRCFRQAAELDPTNWTAKKRLLATYLSESWALRRLWPEMDHAAFRAALEKSSRPLDPIRFASAEKKS